MHSSSSSNPPSIPNSEMPQRGGVKHDAGSGGTISINGTAVHLATPKTNTPSFAAVVSSSSGGGRSNSPFSSSNKTPSSTHLRQKHPTPPSSSGPSSPLGENGNDNKNSFINCTSFTTGNGIAINTHSTISSSSAVSPSCMRNSEGDTPLDNGIDDVENDQEDSESSDVEIYLDSFDSNNSTERMHILSDTNSAYSPGATSTKSSQMPMISTYLHPQSPFHLPTQTKTAYTSINEDLETCGRVQDQEKRGPEPVSVLGADGNGNCYLDAHTASVVSVSSGTHNSPHTLSFVSSRNQVPFQQTTVAHQHASSAPSASSRGPPLPESTGGDSGHQIPESTRMPNPTSSITIDLANLSIHGGHLAAGLTAANAGPNYQGQMGMIVSGSHPTLSSVRKSISPTPYTTLNGIFTSSASDSALCGLADGGNGAESTGSASENGNDFYPGVLKTPNVYINGLKPHFPEDELFNLCNEFGPIRSVRTFTRHANHTESGYGFVLFETIEDAERCITEIRRRHKNLHPTFSKLNHKIPGTNYTAGPSTSCNVSVPGDAIGATSTFKVKMECLHDPTSTNLYMEGLPLSIDEPTLAALVSPHRIVSSRFFQTRLSNPPRIIAFVRLETRVGAEEVIERLHGRMVRGWNDTGSRIAVRFADTSKQRDLRKERAAQDGDTSPSRLTIAEASLLNLRGQDFRSPTKPMQSAHTGNTLPLSSSSSRGFATSVSAPDFSSNGSLAPPFHSNFNLPIIGNGFGRTTPGLSDGGHNPEADYSFALGGHSALHSRSTTPYAGRFSLGRDTFLEPSRSSSSVPHVGSRRGHEDALLDDEAEENFYSQGAGVEVPMRQVYDLSAGQHRFPVSQSVDSMLGQAYPRPSPVYTCSGYTPAEEYIMRAHAESAALVQSRCQQPNKVNAMSYHQHVGRGRPAPLPLSRPSATATETAANIAVGMRAYRAQASLMSPTVSTSTSANSFSSFGNAGELKMGHDEFGLPSSSGGMTEEHFHLGETIPSALKNPHPPRLSRELGPYQGGLKSAALSPFLPVPSSTMSLNHDHSTFSPSFSADVSPNPNDTILSAFQQPHTRSTTLPQHRPSAIANGYIKGHHQHSSMSMPKQNLGTPQHASVARLGGTSSTLMEESSGTIYECDAQGSTSGAHQGNVGSSPLKTHYSSAIFGDSEQSSPLSASSSLISPSLTYGSQTPSTLSPPTPFFGSFSNAEAFDKNGDQHHGQKEMHEGSGCRSGSH